MKTLSAVAVVCAALGLTAAFAQPEFGLKPPDEAKKPDPPKKADNPSPPAVAPTPNPEPTPVKVVSQPPGESWSAVLAAAFLAVLTAVKACEKMYAYWKGNGPPTPADVDTLLTALHKPPASSPFAAVPTTDTKRVAELEQTVVILRELLAKK